MVHLPNMKQNEHRHHHSGCPLQRIADVGAIRIRSGVWQPAANDPQPNQGVEDDRNENESPFQDHHGGIAQRMDFIDLGLIHCCPGQHRGIHRQVHHHVTADRNQAGQGKQAVDEELMTPQKTRFWGVDGNGWFSGFHGLFSQNNGQPAACCDRTEVAAGQKNSVALCSIGIEAGLTRRLDWAVPDWGGPARCGHRG